MKNTDTVVVFASAKVAGVTRMAFVMITLAGKVSKRKAMFAY